MCIIPDADHVGSPSSQWNDAYRNSGGMMRAPTSIKRKGNTLTISRICGIIALAHIFIFMVSGPFFAVPKPRDEQMADSVGAIGVDSLDSTPLPISSSDKEKV